MITAYVIENIPCVQKIYKEKFLMDIFPVFLANKNEIYIHTKKNPFMKNKENTRENQGKNKHTHRVIVCMNVEMNKLKEKKKENGKENDDDDEEKL